MVFADALEALKAGYKVKLPHWSGYWIRGEKDGKDTIEMHCKDGSKPEIRETDDIFYTLGNIASDEWEIAEDSDIKLDVRTFMFGEAIRLLKQGKKVARKGWNGKDMWICLIPHSNNMWKGYPMQDCIGMKNVYNQMQPGWIASQADMLAEDWYEVKG